jgi:type 2 lantibiotic biosynthesis protein LanM
VEELVVANRRNGANVSKRSHFWSRAASLAERRGGKAPAAAASDAARARLDEWKSQPAFSKLGQWGRRLAEHELDEAGLLELLDEDEGALAARLPPPPWLERLDDAFARPEVSPALVDRIDAVDRRFRRACVRLVAPLVEPALASLDAEIAAAAARLPCAPAWLVGALFALLAERLELPMLRTLALEVNVARWRGELAGDTPEERFDDFVAGMASRPAAQSFLAEFPVLARHVATVVDNWGSSSRAFVRHLADGLGAVRDALWGGEDPGELTRIDGGAGDAHRGGRSVMVLGFARGHRVVYKPHSLAVDVHFQDLLRFLNSFAPSSGVLDLKPIGVVDRGDHGFCEFVAAEPCPTRRALARYFRRQGQQLALVYALEGIDIHSENVIAHGEHPVLVDLEALFHPRVAYVGPVDPAADAMLESVSRILFLPQRVDSDEGRAGYDISALGDRPGQVTAKAAALMDELATDTMHVVHRRVPLGANPNRPTLAGSDVDVMGFVDDVCAGFSSMAALLARVRPQLLGPGGPLQAFRDDEVRVILRSTSYYDQMLRTSFHPAFLSDGLERERIFDRLYAEVDAQPALAAAVPHERDDLWRGDIPAFSVRADDLTLYDARGAAIDGVVASSGFANACERLRGLDDRDVARQLWLIRASFATIPIGKGERHWRRSDLRRIARRVSVDERIHMAEAVGDRLVELALRRDGMASWLGVELRGETEWTVEPAQLGLYDGISGIALFLGYLARVTGSRGYDATLDHALATLRARLGAMARAGELVGLGIAGAVPSAIYALAHLGRALGRPELVGEAESLLAPLDDLTRGAALPLDVLVGIGGALHAVLALRAARPSAEATRVARRLGDALVDTAAAQPHGGVAWKGDITASAPLTGFSHGASGLAVALARLAAVEPDARARSRHAEAAAAAVRYEATCLSSDRMNWLDFRTSDDGPPPAGARAMCLWCHGAPGIGLARAALLDTRRDDTWLADLAIAARTTQRQGFGFNHSLCHGDLGNVELLARAALLLDDDTLAEAHEARLAAIADSIERIGWACGVPLGVETPGLFNGIAGIGYGWLRAAAPEQVPSVMTLDPPSPT